MKKVFNKLVRDKIPEIIEENDEYSLTRTLNDKEYEKALYDKLLEEANEVINANKKEETEEELADLLEVVRAIADFKNIDVSDVEKLRIRTVASLNEKMNGLVVAPKLNIVMTTYYKETELEEVLKTLADYLDSASSSESDISCL